MPLERAIQIERHRGFDSHDLRRSVVDVAISCESACRARGASCARETLRASRAGGSGGPRGPVGPCGPTPVAPGMPCGPWMPRGPGGPATPVKPRGPRPPLDPVAPVAPVCPRLPLVPVKPLGPRPALVPGGSSVSPPTLGAGRAAQDPADPRTARASWTRYTLQREIRRCR